MFRFLTLLAFLEASTQVNGAVALISEQCQPVTFPSGAQKTLCFETQITTPGPTAGGVYVGDYAVNYKYSKVAAGIDTYVFWEYPGATKCIAGEVIRGTNTACNSCAFCADGSVEADCTNLDKGRKVACGEGVVRGPVAKRTTPFFPFVMGKLTANQATKSPTKKPTKKPTMKPTLPTKKPTMKPTMKMPTKKPTKTPTNILSCYYNSSWQECQGNYPNPYTCDKFVDKVVCCRGNLQSGYLSSFGTCEAILG